MASSHPSSIDVNDRFQKTGDPSGRVWVVVRLWTATDGLPHARLEFEGRSGETRIMSVSALLDRRFYSIAPDRR
jgi:hypothetical protein